jgi:hypothetical protein
MVVLQVMMDLDEQTSCPTVSGSIANSDFTKLAQGFAQFPRPGSGPLSEYLTAIQPRVNPEAAW